VQSSPRVIVLEYLDPVVRQIPYVFVVESPSTLKVIAARLLCDARLRFQLGDDGQRATDLRE
jgi:hypothetical protein